MDSVPNTTDLYRSTLSKPAVSLRKTFEKQVVCIDFMNCIQVLPFESSTDWNPSGAVRCNFLWDDQQPRTYASTNTMWAGKLCLCIANWTLPRHHQTIQSAPSSSACMLIMLMMSWSTHSLLPRCSVNRGALFSASPGEHHRSQASAIHIPGRFRVFAHWVRPPPDARFINFWWFTICVASSLR